MNRIRCTKLVILAALLSVFAYLMLKDHDAVQDWDHPRSRITSRDIDTMFLGGWYIHPLVIGLKSVRNRISVMYKLCQYNLEHK